MKEKKWIRFAVIAAVILAAAIGAAIAVPSLAQKDTSRFQEKAAALREYALADWMRLELGSNPAGEAGYAVFLSVCDGDARASVYTGAGATADGAWDAAVKAAVKALGRTGTDPHWVKADVLYLSERVTAAELSQRLGGAQGLFRYGAALDAGFQTALLEAELNSAGIYDYEGGGVDLEALNAYLTASGRPQVKSLPKEYTLFQCAGWLCDENGAIYPLSASGADYGQRTVERLDGEYARGLVQDASRFLLSQVGEDGSIPSSLDALSGEVLEGDDILCHAGAVRALLCAYRINPDPELAAGIDRMVGCLLGQVIDRDGDTAYLLDPARDEVTLGGCAAAVNALTEYMDVFQTDEYEDVCRRLGNGILSMAVPNGDVGPFYHVLDSGFTPKGEFRTADYDGQAAYALCRLYGLTGGQIWLDGAQGLAEWFIQANYTQYRSHWVALAMEEITTYVSDLPEYYVFALRNVQENLDDIRQSGGSRCTDLALLAATFRLYDRMLDGGAIVNGFDDAGLLRATHTQAEQMLNACLYPERAMYLEAPQRVVNAFSNGQEGRISIDDVQAYIIGYDLYQQCYERLTTISLG